MNITNELVTEYINGFYRTMTSELGELRDEAEAAKQRKIEVKIQFKEKDIEDAVAQRMKSQNNK